MFKSYHSLLIKGSLMYKNGAILNDSHLHVPVIVVIYHLVNHLCRYS